MAAGKNGGLSRGMPRLPFEALDQPGLLADDVRARAPREDDVDGEVGAEDVLADVAGGVRLVERLRDALLRERHLAAHVEERLPEADRVARDEDALDELVRIALHQHAVLVRAGLGLVAVDDEVARPHTGGRKPHFTPAGKPAPPRPSRLAAFTSSTTCCGGLRSAARRPSYPPVARKRSSVWLSS